MELSKETLAMLGLPETATQEEAEAKIAELNTAKRNAEGERDKFKASFDKTSTELANIKKEKLTEEEKRQEAEKDLKNQLADAQRKLKLNETEKQYMSVGMDSETASKMAQAVLDGDLTAQGEIMKTYTESVAKKAKADALKSQKDVEVGDTDKANKSKYTKENFQKGLISMEEMNSLKESDPNLYNEIVGNKK